MAYLNHGSFGACPKCILEFQQELRTRLERQPVQFFVRDLEPLLDQARAGLARFLMASADDLVFVPNATAGVNTVLHSLSFKPGDQLLVTDHEYNACRNAVVATAEKTGATVCVAALPFPLSSADQLSASILQHVNERTRLVLLDHVTSQTGLILPLQNLVPTLQQQGALVLVDGAHAPGMLPLDLNRLGADFYTGNCHKWLCAPKGAGFLHVQPRHQNCIRPLSISHGANSPRTDRSRFLIEFGWTGTWDPTAMLSVPEAIRFMDRLLPGGWQELMERNHALAVAGRRLLCEALAIDLPCPDSLLGALASLPLPDAKNTEPPRSPLYMDSLQERLWTKHRIEAPVIPWPAPPKRLLRISAQAYNYLEQYRFLADLLPTSV